MKNPTPTQLRYERIKNYSNLYYEIQPDGSRRRVILDPGGACNPAPSFDAQGKEEDIFNFYRHFHGRTWDYRETSAA